MKLENAILTTDQPETIHDQNVAVLAIRTWKTSTPALLRWFRGPVEFFEFLQRYDSQVASTACKAHLQARGDYELGDMKSEKTTDAVASSDEAPHSSAWYSDYKLHEYFLNSMSISHLWFAFYVMGTMKFH